MPPRSLVTALLLTLTATGLVRSQEGPEGGRVAQAPGLLPGTTGSPSPGGVECSLEWLCGTPSTPVAAGDPEVNPDLWQQTWGIAGFDLIPIGSKMAPNGVPYDPLFALDLLLNIALTRDREVYLFTEARFWTQKPGEGITNARQGVFDFSKRQFDLDAGIAWNFYGRLEARALFYSDNNLNRGISRSRPRGFNDGFGLECRCYLPSTNFDRGLYRYVGIGYLPTKDLVGADGKLFKPGFLANARLAYDIIPERFYTYLDAEWISERVFNPKLLITDPGVALRPLPRCPNLEFRVGVESIIDLELAFTRAFLYGNVRIVW